MRRHPRKLPQIRPGRTSSSSHSQTRRLNSLESHPVASTHAQGGVPRGYRPVGAFASLARARARAASVSGPSSSTATSGMRKREYARRSNPLPAPPAAVEVPPGATAAPGSRARRTLAMAEEIGLDGQRVAKSGYAPPHVHPRARQNVEDVVPDRVPSLGKAGSDGSSAGDGSCVSAAEEDEIVSEIRRALSLDRSQREVLLDDRRRSVLVDQLERLPHSLILPLAREMFDSMAEHGRLMDVGQSLTADVPFEELMKRILAVAMQSTDTERATVYLVDDRTQQFHTISGQLLSNLFAEDVGAHPFGPVRSPSSPDSQRSHDSTTASPSSHSVRSLNDMGSPRHVLRQSSSTTSTKSALLSRGVARVPVARIALDVLLSSIDGDSFVSSMPIASAGHALQVVETRKPRLMNGPVDSPYYRETLKSVPSNLLAVPVVNKRGLVVGVLEVCNKKLDAELDATDEVLLLAVADQFAAHIPAALAVREATRLHAKQESLLLATRSFSSAGRLHDAVVAILDYARTATDADRSTFFMLEPDNEHVVCHSSTQTSEDELGNSGGVSTGMRLPADVGIVGYVIRSGSVVNTDNPYAHTRFNRDIDAETGYKTRSLLTVPVVALPKKGEPRKRRIGVIQVLNKCEGTSFTREDERNLIDLAEQVARLVRRVELEEAERAARRQKRDIVRSVSEMAAAVAPEEVPNHIVEMTFKTFRKADSVCLYYVHENEGILRLLAHTDLNAPDTPKHLPLGGSSLVCEVARSGRARTLDTVHDEAPPAPPADDEAPGSAPLRSEPNSPLKRARPVPLKGRRSQTDVLFTSSPSTDNLFVRKQHTLAVPVRDDDNKVVAVLRCDAHSIVDRSREVSVPQVGAISESESDMDSPVVAASGSATPRGSDMVSEADDDDASRPTSPGQRRLQKLWDSRRRERRRRNVSTNRASLQLGSGPFFSDDDMALLQCLADQAGTAIVRSELYTQLELSKRRNVALVTILQATSSDESVGFIIDRCVQAIHDMLGADRVHLYHVNVISGEMWCKAIPGETVPPLPSTLQDSKHRAKMKRMRRRQATRKGIHHAKTGSVGSSVAIAGSGSAAAPAATTTPDSSPPRRKPFANKRALFRRFRHLVSLAVSQTRRAVTRVGSGLVGHVAEQGVTLNLRDAYESEHFCDFERTLDERCRFRTGAVLCVPVKDPHQRVIAVIKCVNRHARPQRVFTETDESLLTAVIQEMSSVLKRKSLEATINRAQDPLAQAEESLVTSMVRHYMQIKPDGSDGKKKERKPSSESLLKRRHSLSVLTGAPIDVALNAASDKTQAGEDAESSKHDSASPAASAAAAAKKASPTADGVPNRSPAGSPPPSNASVSTEELRLVDPAESARAVLLLPSGPGVPLPSTEQQLSDVLTWNMDPFNPSLEELMQQVFRMFDAVGLLREFSIPGGVFRSWLTDVCNKYHASNPYHNFRHAFSVFHCCFMILWKTRAPDLLSPLEALAVCVAALCHDVGHPGYNNNFLVQTGAALALKYNDRSVLENFHACTTFTLTAKEGNNILASLSREDTQTFRKLVIDAILATDMEHHGDVIGDTQRIADGESRLKSDAEKRATLIKAIVHGADVSNPGYPQPIAEEWAQRVLKEFNRQVAAEEKSGVPVTEFMRGSSRLDMARLNRGFIDFIVAPLWTALADLFPMLETNLTYMRENRKYWDSIVEQHHQQAEVVRRDALETVDSTLTPHTGADPNDGALVEPLTAPLRVPESYDDDPGALSEPN